MTSSAAHVRHGDIVRIRGDRWRIVGYAAYGTTAIVDAAGCDSANRAERGRFLLPFEPISRLERASTPRVVTPARWRHAARHALADACPAWASLRAATRANLTVIPFQLEPALALVRGDACRFLIADVVGLGKTVQAGLMIAETLQRQPDARALVVAPAALRDQWRDELRHRFSLEAAIFDAAGIAATAARLGPEVNPWAVEPLVITSIDYIKRPEVMRSVEALVWDIAVLDEAHNLTGRSDRAAAAAMLSDRARALVLLTATPHSGDEQAFGRLCGLGGLGGAEPLATFRRTRADTGLASASRAPLLRVRPTSAEGAMHQALMSYATRIWSRSSAATPAGARLAAAVLTRRACSSADALARSVARRLALLSNDPSPQAEQTALPFDVIEGDDEPHVELCIPGLADPSEERACLERLLALAQEASCAESKIAAIRRLISRTGEPAIVFTEYRDTLQRLAAAFADVDVVQLHGGLTPRERTSALRRFTEGTARLLLATDTGSEGLNLHQRCRLVINLELPWTPVRLEQRAGRVDRIGQLRRVHAVHLIAGGTCEEATLVRLVKRTRRSRGTMNLLTALPDEQHIAATVFGQQELPEAATPSLPEGVVTLDLRREAHDEAVRLARARVLLAKAPNGEMPDRPVMTRIRRRSRCHGSPVGLWLFTVAFTTGCGHLVWEAMVPLRADLAAAAETSRATTRATLAPQHPRLQALLDRRRAAQSCDLQRLLRYPLERWINRELEVRAGLSARHARLSAGLMQRGLFDRRHERVAASQALLLDEALSRSATRLAALSEWNDLRAESCDLVFAVILE